MWTEVTCLQKGVSGWLSENIHNAIRGGQFLGKLKEDMLLNYECCMELQYNEGD
jgi:hypothetical protein